MPELPSVEETKGGLLEHVLRLWARENANRARGMGNWDDIRESSADGGQMETQGTQTTDIPVIEDAAAFAKAPSAILTEKKKPRPKNQKMPQEQNPEPKKSFYVRLPEPLFEEMRAKAKEEGIPHQAYAAMVLQKYLRGAYLDREAVREVVKALVP